MWKEGVRAATVTSEINGACWQKEWWRSGQRIKPSLRPSVRHQWECTIFAMRVVGSCCAHATVFIEGMTMVLLSGRPLLYYPNQRSDFFFAFRECARGPSVLLLCRGERDQVHSVSERLLNPCQKARAASIPPQ